MRLGSLFSGIGGFDLAGAWAGLEVAWQVEIDPQARAVLAARFPGVEQYDDITQLDPSTLAPVDVLAGGFPCQDLSIAGRRAGLAGARSGLFWEYLRLAEALRPEWLVLENVPGLLSSQRGADFALVLYALTGFKPEIPRGGWRNSGLAHGPLGAVGWRVLDAQHFGVPQRRRRVFLVGHSRIECCAEVLFEPESLSGNTPPRRQTWSDTTTSLTSSLGSGGPDAAQAGWLVPALSRALTSSSTATGRLDPNGETFIPHVANTLTKESASGYDASEDGTGRTNIVAFQWNASATQSLTPSGTTPALKSIAGQQPAVAFAENQRAEVLTSDVVRSITNGGGKPGQGYPAVMHPQAATMTPSASGGGHPAAVAFQLTGDRDNPNVSTYDDVHPTINANPMSDRQAAVMQQMAVRRLTPRECERLQGFPDDWTSVEYNGKPLADSPRYRLLGNAVAVPVVSWLLQRIAGHAPD